MNILIIDTSYYNFYRYYATINWYKRVHPEEDIKTIDFSQNNIYLDKFEKMFLDNINKFIKKFKSDKIYFCRDCPRDNIWRVKIYPDYKLNRKIKYEESNFQGGKIFQYCYENILSKLIDNKKFFELKIPKLEADDLIYFTCKYLNIKSKNKPIINIIASDHDLLQIVNIYDNVSIYDSTLKCINSKAEDSADLHNFIKAVTGDTSDNIKQIQKGLGRKTAIKLYENKNLLLSKFEDKQIFNSYNINRLLVDFKYIPEYLEQMFINKYLPLNI